MDYAQRRDVEKYSINHGNIFYQNYLMELWSELICPKPLTYDEKIIPYYDTIKLATKKVRITLYIVEFKEQKSKNEDIV